MKFTTCKKKLLAEFKKNNFKAELENKNKHTKELFVEQLDNGTKIYVVFPGYKAKIKGTRDIVYDYRVDIFKDNNRATLSHANIITDIYNKCCCHEFLPETMMEILIYTFQDAHPRNNFDIASYIAENTDIQERIERCDNYSKPTPQLIEKIKKYHRNLGKNFNIEGNSWNLSLLELFTSIKLIVIQEDINYPIQKNYEGRKMPLARYVETCWVSKESSNYSLKEVIKRALVKNWRPRPWTNYDYSFLRNIKN